MGPSRVWKLQLQPACKKSQIFKPGFEQQIPMFWFLICRILPFPIDRFIYGPFRICATPKTHKKHMHLPEKNHPNQPVPMTSTSTFKGSTKPSWFFQPKFSLPKPLAVQSIQSCTLLTPMNQKIQTSVDGIQRWEKWHDMIPVVQIWRCMIIRIYIYTNIYT